MNNQFLKEVKELVENGVELNQLLAEELQIKFDKQKEAISEVYDLLAEYRHMLSFIDDLEAFVYDHMVTKEVVQGKTFYGATMREAELFKVPPTYIKYKVQQYR